MELKFQRALEDHGMKTGLVVMDHLWQDLREGRTIFVFLDLLAILKLLVTLSF